jgi:hypothetical protein
MAIGFSWPSTTPCCSHRRGIHPCVLKGRQMDPVLHDPDLEPLGILDFLDRPLGGGQMAESVFPVCQALDVGLFEVIEQFLTDRPVQNRFHMFEISEKEGEVQDVDGGAEPAQRAGGYYYELD